MESVPRDYLVRPQCGLSLGPRWEPEPDLALVRPGTAKPYHPAAPDWVAEVAVSSLRIDREVKRRAYAKAGIPEYLIFALPERRVDVLSAPAGGRLPPRGERRDRRDPEHRGRRTRARCRRPLASYVRVRAQGEGTRCER